MDQTFKVNKLINYQEWLHLSFKLTPCRHDQRSSMRAVTAGCVGAQLIPWIAGYCQPYDSQTANELPQLQEPPLAFQQSYLHCPWMI